MLPRRLFALIPSLSLVLLMGLSGCTRITMNQVGQGEACISDEQCTPPLLCVAGLCQSSEGADFDASAEGDIQATTQVALNYTSL